MTFIGNYNANPKLSADEKTLVMIHRQDGFTNFRVAAQDLQRGTVKILTDTNLDESATVAPNGTMVIYATRQQGRGVLMLVSINGRVKAPTSYRTRRSQRTILVPLPELTRRYKKKYLTHWGSLEFHDGNAEVW